MIILFWLLMTAIFYTYIGYPCALWCLSRFYKPSIMRVDKPLPVSILISAYNEEKVIKARIENLLSLDYPADQMEILIGSDGSDDKTAELLNQINDIRLRIFTFKTRRGKMAVLNDLALHAHNRILVFADCRQKFSADAVRMLVRNLSDATIGCVSGELMLSASSGGTGKGVNLYWKYEKFMRLHESRIHSIMGATGAIYAVRKDLYTPIPESIVLDDMFVPLSIIRKGYRAILDPDAKAYDTVADSPREEARRKARTLAGNFQIFGLFPDLFMPWKSPIAIQLFSHKFLRVAAPFLLMGIFLVNIAVAHHNLLYVNLFLMQCIFYAMAFIGFLTRYASHGHKRIIKNICYIPYVFCLLNFSAFIGFIRYISSNQTVTWEK